MSGTPPPTSAEHTIEAPGQTTHIATIRRRIASMLYESLLLLGVLGVGFLLPHLISGVLLGFLAPGPVLLLHVFVLLAGYFIWFWRHGGQTLAMRTWHIQVVSAVDARPPTTRQALLRYALSWPSLLLYGAGLIWALFDRDRQFLHDRLACTRLVHIQRHKGAKGEG